VAFTDAGLDVGAAVTLSTLKDSLVAAVATQDESKTSGFAALAEQTKWIGGTQVRNSATVGGSLVAGHIWGGTPAKHSTPPHSFLTFLLAFTDG
jgi:CO/xanthine dehydrogenase FAD-binding subunit